MPVRLGCIGGVGASVLLEQDAFDAHRVGAVETPFGASGPIYECGGEEGLYFIPRHGEIGYEVGSSFVNYRANVYALKDLGVDAIVAWSAVRAISHNFRIGQFVIVNDVIDETRLRPNTFFENQGLGSIRQWPVFCPELRKLLAEALTARKAHYRDEAVYLCNEGPRRETPAEIRKYVMLGAELIGDSIVPEVFLAKELQLCYADLAYITDYAESGGEYRPYEPGGLFETLGMVTDEQRVSDAVEMLPSIMADLLKSLRTTVRRCHCDVTMDHHIAQGQIGKDWRTWFTPRRPAP
jgi:5'-methylthioadenosine phosphorylase